MHTAVWLSIFLFVMVSATSESMSRLFSYNANAEDASVYQRKRAPCDTFTSVVSFRHNISNFDFCFGTLISPRHILTSATCLDPKVQGPNVNKSAAKIGVCDLRPTAKETDKKCPPDFKIEVSSVVFHPKYSNGKDGTPPYDAKYDIAVAILSDNSMQRWALLPLEPIDCCEDIDLLNLGWGRSSPQTGYATSLEMAGFKYLPYSECKAAFKK